MNNEDRAFREREKLLDEPPIWRKCVHCEGEVVEVSMGDEGLSICQGCGAIEGGDDETNEEML